MSHYLSLAFSLSERQIPEIKHDDSFSTLRKSEPAGQQVESKSYQISAELLCEGRIWPDARAVRWARGGDAGIPDGFWQGFFGDAGGAAGVR